MPTTWAAHGPVVNANFAARVAYSIYDQLVRRDYLSGPGGGGIELVPGLATSWEQVSPTEWDFTIRQGVKFHDGTTMTVDDVVFSINNTYGAGSEPFAASGTIASVVAMDADTVRITTKNPDPALLARMATVMGQVYPQAYYERVGQEEFGHLPVGTGPYKWAGRVTGESVKLDAFDDYWGDTPPLNSITFLEVPEVSSRIAGLMTGEFDIATSIPPSQTRPIDNDAGTEIRAVAVENVQMITFRQYKEGRPQADKRIRKAMALSLDRALLADKLWAGLTTAGTYDFAGYGEYAIPERGPLPFDPEGAKALLADAGYNGEEIVIRIVGGYYTNMTRAVEASMEMWKKVGLNVKLDIIENWGQMGQEGDAYAASDNMWMTDPAGGMWFSWGREGGHRLKDWGGTAPAEFLKLGTDIEQGSDFATRKTAYGDLLELWDDLVPAILLYRPVEAYGVRKGLEWQPYTIFYMDFRAANFKDNG
ncbi:ABC transporter substrate-binding protein [Candidatus Halocynthiibacter alkanivorans]|uniref:ABC transporter substrate-binding protein n=1 Tax=Candidatus Halocynthiibacter alkanivorans TaxID=2267619 RepID=UPI000DF2E5B9|nr:ABC transporter substrate-binding protein [Candidatus Halocynthiibacter alkanivorans]